MDPSLGRFTQPDTLIPGNQGTQAYDRYAYTSNNPLRYTDPTGHRNCLEDGYNCPGSFPVSGSEPPYEPSTWGGWTNCYAYALDLKSNPITGESFTNKPQPGDFSGGTTQDGDSKDDIIDDTTNDLTKLGRSISPSTSDTPCADGSYRVALAIDPLNDFGTNEVWDYHWYRQNPDGTWSHKPGTGPVSNVDGSGRTIVDPENSDRKFVYEDETYFYADFGGYYCVSK
jgi:hypothetical protein